MTVITAMMVKQLRDRTSAGMMDCKKALVASHGDMDKATDYLRENGLSAAEKKSGRVTSEGLVHAYVSPDKSVGVLVEVNCETDFVAKNAVFKAFVQNVAGLIASTNPANLESLVAMPLKDGKTVDETVTFLVNTFGENIAVRRFVRFEATGIGAIDCYIHQDCLTEGKIGVLMESAVGRSETLLSPEFAPFIRSLLMHIAAARPAYLRRNEIPAEVLEREQSIYRTMAIHDGRSDSLVEQTLQGRLYKFYRDSCLLDQAFVKEPDKTVRDLLVDMASKLGDEQISVTRFARFEKGESVHESVQ